MADTDNEPEDQVVMTVLWRPSNDERMTMDNSNNSGRRPAKNTMTWWKIDQKTQ